MTCSQLKGAAVELRASVAGFDQVKADLELLANSAKRLPHVFDALVDFFGSGIEVCAVNIDGDAAPVAGNLRIEAKLADRLADLVSALRASEVNAL